ncbi:MAG: extracellular solute-binding protein, partial [Clostridiales bacterium]|nr:extracellular solute-binding protein [Clostridiales bacterium]
EIEFVTEFGDDNKIEESLQNGEVDIIGLKRQQAIEYAKSGMLEDLTTFFTEKELDKKLYGASIGYGLYNDKIYGYNDMPLTMEFFYNVDLFKKHNLSEPKNLNEVISVATKLKSKGITPIEVGARDNWTLALVFSQINAQTTGSIEATSKYNTDKNGYLTVKDINKSFDLYSQLFNKVISKGSFEINYRQSVDDFVKGKVAILPAGAWAYNLINEIKPANFNYSVFTEPLKFVEEPVSVIASAGGQTIVVPQKSSYKKETMAFLEYLLSDEAQKVFVEAGYISPLSSSNKNDNELQDKLLNHLNITDKNSVIFMDNLPTKMADTLTRVLLDVAEGRVKASEAWSRIIKLTFQQ